MIDEKTGRAAGNGRPAKVLTGKIDPALLAPASRKIKTAVPLVDSAGFIRVRKRTLKGGHPDLRAYRAEAGELATASFSFDLVKGLRIDGKPRHKFVLGLGSQKNFERAGHVVAFWTLALRRMKRRGLAYHKRRRLALMMVRKAARLPTLADCEGCREEKELAAIIRASLPKPVASLPHDAPCAASGNYAAAPLPNKDVTTKLSKTDNKVVTGTGIISREAA